MRQSGALCAYDVEDAPRVHPGCTHVKDMMGHDVIRYDTIRYDAMRCDAIRFGYDTIQHDTIGYDTIGRIRYDTIRLRDATMLRYATLLCATLCHTICSMIR